MLSLVSKAGAPVKTAASAQEVTEEQMSPNIPTTELFSFTIFYSLPHIHTQAEVRSQKQMY